MKSIDMPTKKDNLQKALHRLYERFVKIRGQPREIAFVKEYYAGFGDKLPAELADQLEALEKRMNGRGKPILGD